VYLSVSVCPIIRPHHAAAAGLRAGDSYRLHAQPMLENDEAAVAVDDDISRYAAQGRI